MFAVAATWAADNSRPWTSSDLVPASQLNSQLPEVKAGKIILIQVGFHVMYQMGHIPGSQYAGPASKAEGVAALKKLVTKLPRNQEIVIYCGCCPWDDCPNIRPAFRALTEMGFSNLKVLDIPERLGTDWSAKGYPIVKGE
jgi:rhodanese-related sulfurtransferase